MTTTLTAAYVDDKINQQLPAEEDNSVVSRNTNNMPFHTVEPARNVVVYLNGDRFYPGRKFIVSKKQLHDFDGFLNEVTRGIKPSFGAVRNIYTPSQGHKVFGLEQIENNMALVAGGIERFRSIGYRDITLRPHMKHTTKKASMERIPPRNKLQVPGRWRTISNEPVQIFIHANGDILAPASKILLTPRQMKHWDLILQLITEKISNRTGKAVRKLYDMNYQMLFEPAALENGQSYIAVGSEKLKRLPYGSLGGNRSLRQISPRRANVPLPPIKPKPKTTKKIKRRSKPSESKVVIKASAATGFEPLVSTKPKPPVLPSVKQDSKEEEEESVFHAKPVLVKRQSPSLILQEDEDESNVFRANNGDQVVADEIKEDENTKVDVPIDQLPAEKVEEEIVVEASVKYTESVVETTQEDESVEQRSVENSIEKTEIESVCEKDFAEEEKISQAIEIIADENIPVEEKVADEPNLKLAEADDQSQISSLSPDLTKPSTENENLSAPVENLDESKVVVEKAESPVNEISPTENVETSVELQASPLEEQESSSKKLKSEEEEKPIDVNTEVEENDVIEKSESLENIVVSKAKSIASSVRSKSLKSIELDDDTDTEIETNLQGNLSKATSRSVSIHEGDEFYDNEPEANQATENILKPSSPDHDSVHSGQSQGLVSSEEKKVPQVEATPSPIEIKQEDIAELGEISKEEINLPLKTPDSPVQKSQSPTNNSAMAVDTTEFSTQETEKESTVENVTTPNSEVSPSTKKENLELDTPSSPAKNTITSVENSPTTEKSFEEDKIATVEQNTPSPVENSQIEPNIDPSDEKISSPAEEQIDNLEKPSSLKLQPTSSVEEPADLAVNEATPSPEQPIENSVDKVSPCTDNLESPVPEITASPVHKSENQNSTLDSPEEKPASPTESKFSESPVDNIANSVEKSVNLTEDNSSNLLEKPLSPVEQPTTLENLESPKNDETISPTAPESYTEEAITSSVENPEVIEQENKSDEVIKPLSPIEQSEVLAEQKSSECDDVTVSVEQQEISDENPANSLEKPLSPVEQPTTLENLESPKNDETSNPIAPESYTEEAITSSVENPKVVEQENKSDEVIKPLSPIEQSEILEEQKVSECIEVTETSEETPANLLESPKTPEKENKSDLVLDPSSPLEQSGDLEKPKSPENSSVKQLEDKVLDTKLSTSSSKNSEANLNSPLEENAVNFEENVSRPVVKSESSTGEMDTSTETPNSEAKLENANLLDNAQSLVDGESSSKEVEPVSAELSAIKKENPVNQPAVELDEQSKPSIDEKMHENDEVFTETNQKTSETFETTHMVAADANKSSSNEEKRC